MIICWQFLYLHSCNTYYCKMNYQGCRFTIWTLFHANTPTKILTSSKFWPNTAKTKTVTKYFIQFMELVFFRNLSHWAQCFSLRRFFGSIYKFENKVFNFWTKMWISFRLFFRLTLKKKKISFLAFPNSIRVRRIGWGWPDRRDGI